MPARNGVWSGESVVTSWPAPTQIPVGSEPQKGLYLFDHGYRKGQVLLVPASSTWREDSRPTPKSALLAAPERSISGREVLPCSTASSPDSKAIFAPISCTLRGPRSKDDPK